MLEALDRAELSLEKCHNKILADRDQFSRNQPDLMCSKASSKLG